MASSPKNADAKKEADNKADAPEEAEQASEQPKSRFTRTHILIAAGVVLLFAGGGAGAYFKFFADKAEEQQAVPVVKPPAFFDLPEVLVNLATAGNERTQYLKVKLTLELHDPAQVAQIQPVMPRVMDAFQTYLRELRPTDLEGSAGLYRLKDELTRRVNVAVAPNKVNAVLFKEFIVQ